MFDSINGTSGYVRPPSEKKKVMLRKIQSLCLGHVSIYRAGRKRVPAKETDRKLTMRPKVKKRRRKKKKQINKQQQSKFACSRSQGWKREVININYVNYC